MKSWRRHNSCNTSSCFRDSAGAATTPEACLRDIEVELQQNGIRLRIVSQSSVIKSLPKCLFTALSSKTRGQRCGMPSNSTCHKFNNTEVAENEEGYVLLRSQHRSKKMFMSDRATNHYKLIRTYSSFPVLAPQIRAELIKRIQFQKDNRKERRATRQNNGSSLFTGNNDHFSD